MISTKGSSSCPRPIQHLNFPQHVLGMLDQEERLLQQTLENISRESSNKIRMITREQQVITNKLKSMELRLAASQLRSQQAQEERKRKREAEKRARSMIPLRLLDTKKQPARTSSAGIQRPQAANASKHTISRVNTITTTTTTAVGTKKGRTVTGTGRSTKATNTETTVMKILPRFYCNFFPRGQSS